VKFHLVRHGDIATSDLPDLGHNDPSLSDTGRRQAHALAHELDLISKRGPAIEAVYTSPMRPAAETAAVIADALGTGQPLTSEALGTLTPEVLPPYGGLDALTMIQDRAWSLIETLREQHDERSVVVLVSHELTVRAIVCRALGMPLTDLKRYELDPASLSTIEFRRAPNGDLRTILAALNEGCHLDAIGA
jgi:broad specificity phosphatase PhoE